MLSLNSVYWREGKSKKVSKVAHYLQQHLAGEVLTSPEVLDYFSTDESIFTIKPMLVVHPRGENDLRKAARFSWQLAERGRRVPITIKGKGTDQSGASLGNGIVLTTPAHLNKIIELDPKSGVVSIEAGANIGKLQQTLHTHGRFLPSVSSAAEYSTIGGAVANNDAGSSAYKYGPVREFVRGMRVVLSNGELIRTERLSKRELNKKLGLASFEGEIYRALDKLIEESQEVIETLKQLSDRNNAGYAITEVKLKDGSFDLTPLFAGSQGTIGLISEITLQTEPHSAQTDLLVGLFNDRSHAWRAVSDINELKDGPLAVDFIDKTVLSFIAKANPNLVKNTLDKEIPATVLFIEIEKKSGRTVKKTVKRVRKIIEDAAAEVVAVEDENRQSWLALRDSPSLILTTSVGSAKAVPLIDDAVVPIGEAAGFIDRAEKLLQNSGQRTYAFWGQAGNGVIHTAPMFDISQTGERQQMFRLLDSYYDLVSEVGGSIAGEFAEGRLRGSQVAKILSDEQRQLMSAIKKIFDPHDILNPGVKVNVDVEQIKPLLRSSYSLDHQYSHLPRG